MDEPIQQTLKFRISQSEEKLKLAAIMLSKEQYNDAVIYSYLSMFYSVRVLLLNRTGDTDDYEKILDLAEKYYDPSGWTSIDVISLLKEAKAFKEKIEETPGIKITKDDGEKFYNKAVAVLQEVIKQTPK